MNTAVIIVIATMPAWLLVAPRVGDVVGRWWSRRRRPPLPRRREWCEVCGQEITAGFVIRQAMAAPDEVGGGGTGMSAYSCTDHRPAAGVAWPA